ncbi:MAG: GNAT family N-acetyltransferase [Bdellovibrionaceae bacterium]|nr:GNAT family N-acetyltransferase [Bdellovibrionales bacterium]MCB9253857.1 GNAT family N-acetyltransferase [Pseudobdellovibrionaceae bacterium]
MEDRSLRGFWITAEEAADLKEEWNALASEMRPNMFYFEREFFNIWARFFAGNSPIKLLMIRDTVKLRLAAPFYYRDYSWRLCADRDADHPLIIFSNDDTAAVSTFWQMLEESGEPVIVPSIGRTTTLGRLCPKPGTYTSATRLHFTSKEINALGHRIQTHRYKNLINWYRKQGDFTYLKLQTRSDIEKWLPQFAQLHERRWSSTRTPSSFTKPIYRDFCSQLISTFAPRSRLTLDALVLGDNLLAGCLGTERNGTKGMYLAAYDTNYWKKSPGKLLLAYILSEAKKSRLVHLDFLRGSESYKHRYKPKIEHCFTFKNRSYRRSWHGLLDYCGTFWWRAKRIARTSFNIQNGSLL